MAVVIPIYLALVFGMIEFGRAVMMKQAVTDAARVACRTATLATTQSSDTAKSLAFDVLRSASSNTSNFDVSVSPDDFNGIEKGTDLSVVVSVNYSDVSWLVPGFLGDVSLRGEATMERE